MTTLSDRNLPYTAPSEKITLGVYCNPELGIVPIIERRLYPRDSIITKEYSDRVGFPQDTKEEVAKTGIDLILAERGNRYGKFTGHAQITQSLKTVMHNAKNWSILADDQKEALEMIAHKVGRILNGDPNYDDSWVDVGGYSKLVADRLTSGTEV